MWLYRLYFRIVHIFYTHIDQVLYVTFILFYITQKTRVGEGWFLKQFILDFKQYSDLYADGMGFIYVLPWRKAYSIINIGLTTAFLNNTSAIHTWRFSTNPIYSGF